MARLNDLTTEDVRAMFARWYEKERRARKLQDEELAQKLDVVMTMLDGWKRGGYTFRKDPVKMILDQEASEDSAGEFLSNVADALEARS